MREVRHMTRRTVVTCDRCAAPFDVGGAVNIVRLDTSEYLRETLDDERPVSGWDLCEPCLLALKRWLASDR